MFPLFKYDEDISVDFDARLKNALDKLKLPSCWNSGGTVMNEENFKSRFGFTPNNLQSASMEIASKAEKPLMMIIEAQMGIGKTEASLAAAEIMAAQFGCGGVFFGLPTQATTNCIFDRMLDFLESSQNSNSENQFFSVRLAHSNYDLVDSYLSLKSVYSVEQDSDAKDEESNNKNSDAGETDIVTHSWFEGRKT